MLNNNKTYLYRVMYYVALSLYKFLSSNSWKWDKNFSKIVLHLSSAVVVLEKIVCTSTCIGSLGNNWCVSMTTKSVLTVDIQKKNSQLNFTPNFLTMLQISRIWSNCHIIEQKYYQRNNWKKFWSTPYFMN